MRTITAEIAERLRRLKEREGLPNTVLAARFGIAASEVGRILRNEAWPRPD